jgi:hypothetical protein
MLVLFEPAFFDGRTLNRHDIIQWRAASGQVRGYREETGEEPLWTHAMFSGMPATLVSTHYWGDVLQPLLLTLNFARPYTLIFIACLGFYLLMMSFGVRPYTALVGAIAFGCSSYLIIGLAAGHSSRIAAVAFMPMVMAGCNWLLRGQYRWGFIVTALSLALEIKVNHLQITYYLALVLLVMGINYLIIAIREKDPDFWTKKVPLLVLAVTLAVGANLGKLWSIVDYGKYSTRGKSELVKEDDGLDKSYVFEFSNDITEPLVTFIPNFYGGSSSQSLSEKSALAKALRAQGASRMQVEQYIQSVPTYWGSQRLSAPYYAGAILVFLMVLGWFILEKKVKIWLTVVLIIGIVLSWGDNFPAINYFLFDYLPGYNKFRSVTFTIILTILAIAILGTLALDKILHSTDKKLQKKFFYALGIAGGFALLAGLFAGMGSYRGAVDEALVAQQTPDWFIDALREDRARLLRIDALRSAFLVVLAAGAVWLVMRKSATAIVGAGIITLLVFIDVVLIDKRFLKEDNFQEGKLEEAIRKTAADQVILADTTDYRVMNLRNPFNDATTAYYHNAIGGYHGAKLGRYQELIEYHLSPEMNALIEKLQTGRLSYEDLDVLNMLNAKYFKYGSARDNVLMNSSALGSAWVVSEVHDVNSPQKEIDKLGTIDTRTEAVIDRSKFPTAKHLDGGAGSIALNMKKPNRLKYTANMEKSGLAVFSEIYYPKGWKARIDGQPADILRVNYVLRALKVPEGKNEIEFEYAPEIYRKGNYAMLASGLMMYALCLGFLLYPVFRRKL